MSGDGKRSVAAWPKLPRPSSTLLQRRFAATQQYVSDARRSRLLSGIASPSRLTRFPTCSESWQPSGTIRKRKGAPAFGPARHSLLHYNTPIVASNHEAFEDRRAVLKAKPQQAH
jgi:hypothetical protein